MNASEEHLPTPRPAWIAGRAEQSDETLSVHHPYDGDEIATVCVPSADQVERAVAAAVDSGGHHPRQYEERAGCLARLPVLDG